MNLDSPRRHLASFTTDPRGRQLLPVMALLILALVAIPALLSRSGTASHLSPLPPVPVMSPPAGVAITRPAPTRPVAQPRISGPLHNPFIKPSSPTSAAVPRGAVTAAVSAPITPTVATVAPVRPVTPTTVAPKTRTVTVTVTVPTKAPPTARPKRPLSPAPYSLMEVQASLRQQGATATVFRNLSRDEMLPEAQGAFITFLGVKAGTQRAVFVLAENTTVTGTGRCAPVAGHCRFLVLAPRQSVTLEVTPVTGAVETFHFRYRAVHKVTTSANIVTVDPTGRLYVRGLASDLRPLRTISYTPRSGLLHIRLGRTHSVGGS
ncbi:hypothetical protein [Conexibacter sp. DBS9H8]|uniref:hypothetical protein n=1 Tax=Conexibacter sp. DBS9H8 TaxID=2937801 RepID=UPI00200EC38A|nr:hypothetical protein [Conexibacter sp. DBS9H8]